LQEISFTLSKLNYTKVTVFLRLVFPKVHQLGHSVCRMLAGIPGKAGFHCTYVWERLSGCFIFNISDYPNLLAFHSIYRINNILRNVWRRRNRTDTLCYSLNIKHPLKANVLKAWSPVCSATGR
jgi:hypothetical protein